TVRLKSYGSVTAREPRPAIRRGWSFGAEDFVARLHTQCSTEPHHARERAQTEEQKADAITLARLKKLGWVKTELVNRHKGDPHKATLERGLRSQTTMSLKWVAQRLQMGS